MKSKDAWVSSNKTVSKRGSIAEAWQILGHVPNLKRILLISPEGFFLHIETLLTHPSKYYIAHVAYGCGGFQQLHQNLLMCEKRVHRLNRS